MSGTVLADTGPLYAADPSDDHHERAQGDIRRLNSEGLARGHGGLPDVVRVEVLRDAWSAKGGDAYDVEITIYP